MNHKGYTITELLLVMVVIGILAGVAIPNYNSYRSNANKDSLKSDIGAAAVAYRSYHLLNRDYCAPLEDVGLGTKAKSFYTKNPNYYFGFEKASGKCSSVTKAVSFKSSTALPHTKCKNQGDEFTLGGGNTYSGIQVGYHITHAIDASPIEARAGKCATTDTTQAACTNLSVTAESSCTGTNCSWVMDETAKTITDVCKEK